MTVGSETRFGAPGRGFIPDALLEALLKGRPSRPPEEGRGEGVKGVEGDMASVGDAAGGRTAPIWTSSTENEPACRRALGLEGADRIDVLMGGGLGCEIDDGPEEGTCPFCGVGG